MPLPERLVRGVIRGLRPGDLDLSATLRSGQVFRWWQDDEGAWRGTVGTRRFRLAQSEDNREVLWEADGPEPEAAVRSFLRLEDADLPALAEEWSQTDSYFAAVWQQHPGVRLLRQEPDECFFSFLCASVAPIRRISGMLNAVAGECGTDLGDGFLAFPTAKQLTCVSETRLRELGLGFRAVRVANAARLISELPSDTLRALRDVPHADAKRALQTTFFGIGEKIADCICLFSLNKDGAIPVDTHIWRIARQRYLPELEGKSLTTANYARVVAAFHERFGEKAGWAQQILFYRAAVGRQSSRVLP